MDHKQDFIRMLIARLERLSADSYWAHQASGVRGSLLRLLEAGELDSEQGALLVERGFDFLEKAAKEK
ncbi:MAG: hypothetical protein IMY85_03685 [Chloroflexi bacterium]|nr:hypothetical protein [Chloroflexota bacterium]